MSEGFVKKNFAEIYDREHGIVIQELDKFLPSFLDKMDWNPNEVILDHGCGIGKTCLKYLVPKIQSGMIYGIDISNSMIKYAQEKYSHQNVKYIQTDLMSPEFELKDMKFDKIFSTFVIQLMHESHREILARMYDLLIPGGYLVTTEKVDGYQVGVRSYLKKHNYWLRHSENLAIPHFNAGTEYSPPACIVTHGHEVRAEQGFEIIENKHWPSTYKFDNVQCSAEFTLAHDPLPHEENLTAEEQDKLYKEVLTYLNSGSAWNVIGKTDDNKFQVKYGVAAVLARKPQL